MSGEVTLVGAFAAGLLSFFSPCLLPLVPAYLAYLGGVTLVTTGDSAARTSRLRLVLAAIAFVTGFTSVFVVLGASASAIGRALANHIDLLVHVSGIVFVVMGLQFAGLIRVPWLERDARFHPASLPAGIAGAFTLGLAFAFGWTPCVGPILATILAVAASQHSVARGIALLATYGAGIGVPFLAIALGGPALLAPLRSLRRWMRPLQLSLGGIMVLTGFAIFAGTLANVGGWLLDKFPALGRIG